MKIKGHELSEAIRIIDRRYGLSVVENLFAVKWFNPFATLWLNFRCFPFSQAIKLPIWCYGSPRFYGLSGRMIVDGPVTSGMIRFNQTRSGSPNYQGFNSEITNEGTIIFKGKGVIGTGNKIFVDEKATLEIGANFKITDMCNIGCFTNIVIGAQTWIVHQCQLLDSNYHYLANFEKGIVPNQMKPIKIGKGCWVCNRSTITGGAILPDYTIIASNSLVGKDFTTIKEGSLVGGSPAKYIASGFRRIDNKKIDNVLHKFFFDQREDVYQIPEGSSEELYSTIS